MLEGPRNPLISAKTGSDRQAQNGLLNAGALISDVYLINSFDSFLSSTSFAIKTKKLGQAKPFHLGFLFRVLPSDHIDQEVSLLTLI